MENQKIRIRLQGFDHRLLDQAARDIVSTVERTGAVARGPIPLPRRRNVYTVKRSPHIDKESQEQFEIRTFKRVVDIENSTPQTVDALGKLELPAGVGVKIEVRAAA